MIIALFVFAMLIIGIIGIVVSRNDEGGFAVLTFFGAILSFATIIIIISASAGNTNFRNEYAIHLAYVDAVSGNNSLTADERVSVIKTSNEINDDILWSRSWGKNVWVGWFIRDIPAEYPIIDVSRITNANQQFTINVSDSVIGE